MFDIGFWELLLIGTIGLIVIGPKRLPSVIHWVGKIVGKMNYFINKFKADIQLELKTEELKKTLAKQAQSTGIHEITGDIKSSVNKIRDELLADADHEELIKVKNSQKINKN